MVFFQYLNHSGTLLTAALLMRATDRKNYHSESLEFLDRLKKHDSNRTGYYTDMANKWSIEHRLADWISALETNRDAPIDLSDLSLVNLHYKQYLCVADQINLSTNPFDAKRIDEISTFFNECNVKYELVKSSDP